MKTGSDHVQGDDEVSECKRECHPEKLGFYDQQYDHDDQGNQG